MRISYSPVIDLPIREGFKLQFRRTRLRAQAPRPATEREREIWRMARDAAARPVEELKRSYRERINAIREELIQKHGVAALRAQGCRWVDDVTYWRFSDAD